MGGAATTAFKRLSPAYVEPGHIVAALCPLEHLTLLYLRVKCFHHIELCLVYVSMSINAVHSYIILCSWLNLSLKKQDIATYVCNMFMDIYSLPYVCSIIQYQFYHML